MKGAKVRSHRIMKGLVGLIAALAMGIGGPLLFASAASASTWSGTKLTIKDVSTPEPGKIAISLDYSQAVNVDRSHVVIHFNEQLVDKVDDTLSGPGSYNEVLNAPPGDVHVQIFAITQQNAGGPLTLETYYDDIVTVPAVPTKPTPVAAELSNFDAHAAGENLIVVGFDYTAAENVSSSKAIVYFDGQVAAEVDTAAGDSYSKALPANTGDVVVTIVTETQAEAGGDVATETVYEKTVTVDSADEGTTPPSDGPTTIDKQPATPTATDDYGIDHDVLNVPEDTDTYTYKVDDQRVDGVGLVRVTVVPAEGYVFGGKVQTTWELKFTNEARPSDGESQDSPKPAPSTEPSKPSTKPEPSTKPTEPSKPSTKPAVPVASNDNDTPAPVAHNAPRSDAETGLPSAATDVVDTDTPSTAALTAGLLLLIGGGVGVVLLWSRRRAATNH